MSLNLEKQLTFYGAYHHNSVNIGIHILCVPIILLSSLFLGTYSPSIPVPEYAYYKHLPPNVGTIGAVLYAAIYVLLEPVAGTVLSVLLLVFTGWANHYTSNAADNTPVMIAAGLFFVCWIAQFVGHGVFEKRAPALLDNIFQAFVLAPLFVWLEVLFSFGYRAELKQRMDTMVDKEIAKYRSEQARLANGKNK